VKARLRIKIIAPLRWISVWGPGLLVMLADTAAGNVVTAAQAGAQWRYRLLPLLLVLMPMLYIGAGTNGAAGYLHRARPR
jgi:Mn2+/Fe2+ NRAMP family transporter